MRARHPTLVVAACCAVVLLLLGTLMAVQLQLSAVWRVALDSIDDPAAQDRDEGAPANAPSAHRGREAAARIAAAPRAAERITPTVDTTVAAAPRAVSAPRAPPAA